MAFDRTNEGILPTRKSTIELAVDAANLKLLEEAIQSGCDVNEQNDDGDSALHIAIAGEADIALLKILMENGARLTTENETGYTPLDHLLACSLDTIFNLLRLERSMPIRERFGNTLLHLLINGNTDNSMGTIDDDIPRFWSKLLEEMVNLNIDLNAKNKKGQTPLHLCAMSVFSSEHLNAILTHFDCLNALAIDQKGDTFFHIYLEDVDLADNFDFLFAFLEGTLRICPKPVVQTILLCQNDKGNTPLHMLLKNVHRDNEVSVDILEAFVEAGANINIKNKLGETALHCVIRDLDESYEDEEENIRYLVNNGANINSRDEIGESPIFYTMKDKESMCTLLDMGADINIRNKFGQTALISHLHDLEIIEMLLEKGIEVNAQDINGSNVLHHVAWKGTVTEIIPLLKRHGVQVVPDKLGHLPCHVAHYCRNKDMFAKLCNCDADAHKLRDHFDFQHQVIEYTETDTPIKQSKEFDEVLNRFQRFQGDNISDILSLSGIGSVVFEDEAECVRVVVTDTIKGICDAIREKDKLFAYSLIQSGSVGENTKIGSPNEFDFVCIFDKIGEMCYVNDKKSEREQGFAYLTLRTESRGQLEQYLFNEDGYLDTFEVWQRFKSHLDVILHQPETFSHPNIWFVADRFKEVYSPTCQFTMRWSGCFYKSLVIDIDIVPACQVKGWWPKNTNFQSLACDVKELKKEGALLLFQTEMQNLKPDSKLRISALKAEKNHMGALPSHAKDAYVVSKILCDNRVCPNIRDEKDIEAKDVLTSYMLKNCMFHSYKSNITCISQTVGQHSVGAENEFQDTLKFVQQIFQTLRDYSDSENLPSFVFPWQNIFTFKIDHMDETLNHNKCKHRSLFAKIILTILGDLQIFKNSD